MTVTVGDLDAFRLQEEFGYQVTWFCSSLGDILSVPCLLEKDFGKITAETGRLSPFFLYESVHRLNMNVENVFFSISAGLILLSRDLDSQQQHVFHSLCLAETVMLPFLLFFIIIFCILAELKALNSSLLFICLTLTLKVATII